MTIIFGTLEDVGGQLAQGTVTVSSLVTRPAHGSASTVITKERHVLPLRNGVFESPDLDPGPVLVEATTGGAFESWQVLLPEDGRHDLATLIETHVDYSPSVVGRVEAAAADANRAAQAAGLSATRAAQAESTVVTVVADGAGAVRAELRTEIDGTSQARIDAQAAQAAAEAAAARAAADARAEIDPLIDVAAGHEAAAEEAARQAKLAADASRVDADRAATVVSTAAGQVRMEMQGYVNAATASEVSAAGSAQASANSAGESLAHADRAKAHADDAAQTKIQIDTTAEQVARDRDAAASSATTAGGHATTAGEARTGAEAARDEAVQAAEGAKTGAPTDGWPRATLHEDVQASLSRADNPPPTPKATATAPGVIQLAGDLGGTAGAPTVPGLAGKMDAQPVSDGVTSSTLVKRTSGATIKTARPQADDDAATKKYVDDASASLTAAINQRATTTYVDGAVSAEQARIAALESAVSALTNRVTSLESAMTTVVKSSVVRTIAKGTGTSTSTLYIEGV